MYTSVKATTEDAELILKLYDLRREEVMRKARHFIGQFFPQSVDDVMEVATAFGSDENAYFRQVLGYWEMAASLVLRGAVHEELFLDNAGEMFFVFAKFAPYLQEIREKLNSPKFLALSEELINQTMVSRERLEMIMERQKEMARRAAASRKKAA